MPGEYGRVMARTQNRSRSLPENPSAEHLRKEAKRLARGEAIQLAAAQRRLAREYGYRDWSELIRHVKSLSAAYKATREADKETGAIALEAGPALEALLKLPVAQKIWALVRDDLPLDLNLIERLLSAEVPDLMQLRLRILDESGDRPDILELLEKLGIPRATALELEKDLPFLPLRDLIAFPHIVYPVFLGRPKSIKAIRSAVNRQLPIVMAAQKDPAVESPNDADIYRIGVVGNVIKVADLPDGTLKALIECRRRVRVTLLMEDGEFMEARTEELTEPVTEGLDELLESVASAFVSSRFKSLAANRSSFLTSCRNPSVVADRIANDLPIEVSQKQELLELLNPAKRLEKLLGHLSGPLGP
jgi:Lon protease-like protein